MADSTFSYPTAASTGGAYPSASYGPVPATGGAAGLQVGGFAAAGAIAAFLL